jgi:hypothetical protein
MLSHATCYRYPPEHPHVIVPSCINPGAVTSPYSITVHSAHEVGGKLFNSCNSCTAVECKSLTLHV